MSALEVLAPGPLATVQDLGRPGLAALGVGASGAADRASLRLANRLVGNAEDAAGVELTFGGLRARATGFATVALTGAPCPASAGGRAVGMNAPIPMRPGDVLVIGAPTQGARTYLAVRGGIDVPPVLGARSTDVLSGLGPEFVQEGTVLPIGREPAGFPTVDQAPVRRVAGEVTLRVIPGPRADWFAPDALGVLCGEPYHVTSESNRVGARLEGPELRRAGPAELQPEGMVRGALQVPPHGRPVLLLADHPVTGGYPIIAVVVDEDVDLAAQLRPGEPVRFRIDGPRPT
ncbi:biotin-dependent carboxyltransferase family protein [Actinospica durhamensis]|uniref:Biotin-dependent carboxyltransferase family protein n=1 Tax=Actinospica durhamensis TaxID=1508375 RepID=A0A941EU00_9ACTN|nr:biotin-dependent carboxyltransferase family protein [Actinospica durhamensis]MBR7838310.1 biotin-dependent carboxyltransferase family protein [Actinospica durhamensis]